MAEQYRQCCVICLLYFVVTAASEVIRLVVFVCLSVCLFDRPEL